MKNKRSIYTIAIIFTCAILSSCSDWLDVNHNPNSAEKVDPGYLFNYAVVNWAGSRTGGDAYIPLSQSIQCQADGGDDYGGWAEGYYVIDPRREFIEKNATYANIVGGRLLCHRSI